MAPFKDYAAIAIATYYEGEARYPTGHSVSGYTCKIWETGTWFGNGFQGGVYQSDKEIVVGFCGTFNSPGMKYQIKLSAFNFMKPVQMKRTLKAKPTESIQGWNFRLKGDPVSKFGHHVGTEVELDYVEGLGGKHGKDSCMLAMAKSGWWSEDVGWYF